MHVGRRDERKAAVPMLVVVPVHEAGHEGARGVDRGEERGKLRTVLERLEVGFGEGVVVGNVRSRMRLGNTEIGEEQRKRLGLS
jgi:hypothetical protein